MNFPEIVHRWERRELGIEEVRKLCSMSDATFYRRLRELRTAKKTKGE